MIIAFVYNFPHFKSAQGLFALKRAGANDVRVVAAPRRDLRLTESPFQFRTVDMDDAHHPAEAARALGYRYRVMEHADVRLSNGDVGIILGARVLPDVVVHSGGPIMNLHPGVMPDNRGLDTLKWAVHDDLPQAISIHRIDARIDRGELVHSETIAVLPDDTPADIYNRLMWRQIALVSRAVAMAQERGRPVGTGVYRRPMTAEEDVRTMVRFPAWRARFANERLAA